MITYSLNRKAKYDFILLDSFEAGIVLSGAEVKSVRAGKISLKESFVKLKNSELFLTQAHIANPSYVPNYAKFDETQERKLLMHKKEINKLAQKIKEKGLTLIAVSIYQKENTKKIKVHIALAKGKRLHDKKNIIKERDIKRDMARVFNHDVAKIS